MIINGNAAGNVGYWASHLLRADTNENVTVKAIDGLTAANLPAALREMQALAAGSKSQGSFMYQANINPQEWERLTPEQWVQAVDTLERNLGFEGHQRVIVEHEKHGRQHYHVIWNRVDADTMRVADIGGNWKTHERTSRELERAFDLTPTPSNGGASKTTQLWEHDAAARSGIDPREVKAEMSALWRSSESGQDFAAAVEARGYVLAQGDRRDFCIVDHAGTPHSLAKRLDGVRTAEVREHMGDVDRAALPTVAQASALQRERYPEAGLAWAERPGSVAALENPRGEFARAAAEIGEPAKAATADRIEANDNVGRIDPVARDAGATADRAIGAGLGIADAFTGVAEKLSDAIVSILDSGPPPPPNPTQDRLVADIIAQRRATAALEQLAADIAKDQPTQQETLRDLPPSVLQGIQNNGDDYLRALVARMEEERQRDDDRGRAMER